MPIEGIIFGGRRPAGETSVQAENLEYGHTKKSRESKDLPLPIYRSIGQI